MKKIMIMVAVTGILYACSSESNSQQADGSYITISGKVMNPQADRQIILSRYVDASGESEVIDTLELNGDKTFSERVEVPYPSYYKLDFFGRQVVNLILDDDDIELTVDGQQPRGYAEVKGSADHDFILRAQQSIQEFQQSMQIRGINDAFVAAQQANDGETMDSLRSRYMELDRNFKTQLLKSADTMETSLGVVEVMKNQQMINPDDHFQALTAYADRVEKDMPESPMAMDFVQMVNNMEKLAIGS